MKFAKREKYFIIITGCAVGIILLLEVAVNPFFRSKAQMRRGIQTSESELRRIAGLGAASPDSGRSAEEIERIISERKEGFALFPIHQRAAENAQIGDKVKNIRPSETKSPEGYTRLMVEIRLENITAGQLTNYLYQIEDPENLIFVNRIAIVDNKNEGYLDATIQVITYAT